MAENVHSRRDPAGRLRQHHSLRYKLAHRAAWTSAGYTAGRFAGPVGHAAVGVVHYRKDLQAGGHRTRHAVVKIGAPIAISVVAGIPGTIAYEGYDHRRWIKRHLLHREPAAMHHAGAHRFG